MFRNEHTNVLSSIEQESLLKDLPTSLGADILSHTHKSLIKKNIFSRGNHLNSYGKFYH